MYIYMVIIANLHIYTVIHSRVSFEQYWVNFKSHRLEFHLLMRRFFCLMDLEFYSLKFVKSKPESIRFDLYQHKTETRSTLSRKLKHVAHLAEN